MFPAAYFASRFFAPRYFAKIGGLDTTSHPGRGRVVITGARRAAQAEVTQ